LPQQPPSCPRSSPATGCIRSACPSCAPPSPTHLTTGGLPTRADQILVSQGALHGWDLLLRTLTSPGDRVLIESPSYPSVVDAASAHRVRIAPIGVSAAGWDLSAVRPARGAAPAVLAHITPDHQNPTGFHAPAAARRELLAALPPSTLVIADETFRDPHPRRDRPPTKAFGDTMAPPTGSSRWVRSARASGQGCGSAGSVRRLISYDGSPPAGPARTCRRPCSNSCWPSRSCTGWTPCSTNGSRCSGCAAPGCSRPWPSTRRSGRRAGRPAAWSRGSTSVPAQAAPGWPRLPDGTG